EMIGGEEPTPELAAQFVEEFQRLMEQLEDPSLRRVAALKLEGYTNDEIAARLGCVTSTVERKLAPGSARRGPGRLPPERGPLQTPSADRGPRGLPSAQGPDGRGRFGERQIRQISHASPRTAARARG